MGTRTLARLQVSQSTFDEIAGKLRAAEIYGHAFLSDGNIAMDEIALEPEPGESHHIICQCGHPRHRHVGCGPGHHDGSPHDECCDECGCDRFKASLEATDKDIEATVKHGILNAIAHPYNKTTEETVDEIAKELRNPAINWAFRKWVLKEPIR